MTMFDNGLAAEASLSDEALFGAEDGAPEVDSEVRLGAEQPQTEAQEEGPAAEQISLEPEAEAAQPEEPAEEPETEVPPATNLEKQLRDTQARMSRACQEAAEAKRANAVLQAQLDQIKAQVQQPIDPQAKEKFLQQLVDDPHQAISRYVSEQTSMAVQQQVKQLLQPVIQSVEQKGREQAWDAAWQEHSNHWPQLMKQEAQTQLVERMAHMSADLGDSELWQKQPAKMLQMAAIDLFGLPKAVNEDAIRAANDAGRKAAFAERQAKEAAKPGLAAGTPVTKNQPPTLSAEDEIVQGISNAMGGKLL